MRLVNVLLMVFVVVVLWAGAVFAEEAKTTEPVKADDNKTESKPVATEVKAPEPVKADDSKAESKPVEAEAAKTEAAKPDAVVVTVAGHAVKEADVEAQLDKMLAQQSMRRKMSDEDGKQFRIRMRSVAIEGLVNKAIGEYVVAEEARQAKIEVSAADIDAKIEEMMSYLVLRHGMSREELQGKIAEGQGMSFDEFIKKQKATPEFAQMVLLDKMVAHVYGEELKVSDQEIEEYYKKNLENEFSEGEQVQASHILIDTRKLKTDEEKAAAKKKAEELCVEAKKPDADFVKLASENSACPSAAKGGDLGFFTKDKMVAPFSEAAFAMEKGGISDVVETQFGYHVIKVTDKKPAHVTSLADAKEKIRANMFNEKRQKATEKYYDELKEKANIVYSAADAKEKKDEIIIK
jgi:peptidyl-prolyl cis-trans isomerase C